MPDPIKNQQITELEGKLTVVRDRAAKAFEEAKVEKDGQAMHDFTRVKVYGEKLTTTAVAEKIREDEKAMTDLVEEIKAVKEAEGAYQRLTAPASQVTHPAPSDAPEQKQAAYKSLGQKLAELPGLKESGGSLKSLLAKGSIEIKGVSVNEFKTLFETSAGWAPESIRSGMVVPAVTRPIQLLDILPVNTIGQAADVYMEETTLTHNAAETAEGGTYQESTFELTQRSHTVEKITNSIPVTDEQLEDVPAGQSYLEDRIRFGIRQRLDSQCMNGTGVTPLLLGILQTPNIQTQAKGADPAPDAFYKAMVALGLTGRVSPTHHVMHPNNWQTIRLTRTVDGIYIWGNPSEAGPERLWGLPVVKNDAMAAGTGLVGSFEAAWIALRERRGIMLELGYTGTQFTEGKQTIRASMRGVLSVYRPVAFCTVTGLL